MADETATVTVLAGGVGAARLLSGLARVVEPAALTAVVNVGDDLELHGLHVSPDLDTVVYTLAGAVNPQTGWGLAGETWQAMAALGRYGGATWFNLGDRDLGTHLFRTQRLREGACLTTVTAEIASGWKLGLRVLPVTDDPVRTRVTIVETGPGPGGESRHEVEVGEREVGRETDRHEVERETDFQEYFVKLRHSVPVRAVRFAGADTARPGPAVLDAIGGADVVVIAPSNPIVSIAPVLAVPGVRAAVAARRDQVVAVSPIIAGRALKGPADRLLAELGHEPSVVGVARLYTEVCSTLVIDEADAARADEVEAEGVRCVVAPTVMHDADAAAALARVVIGAAP